MEYDEELILEAIIEDLEIDKKNIFLFRLINGDELLGEVISSEDSPDHVIMNPVRIVKTYNIDEYGAEPNNYFTIWNTYNDDPDVTVSQNHIVSKIKPFEELKNLYLYFVYDMYYPVECEVDMDFVFEDEDPAITEAQDEAKSNVIAVDFKKNKDK